MPNPSPTFLLDPDLGRNASTCIKKAHFRIENGLLNLLPLLGSNQRPSD